MPTGCPQLVLSRPRTDGSDAAQPCPGRSRRIRGHITTGLARRYAPQVARFLPIAPPRGHHAAVQRALPGRTYWYRLADHPETAPDRGHRPWAGVRHGRAGTIMTTGASAPVVSPFDASPLSRAARPDGEPPLHRPQLARPDSGGSDPYPSSPASPYPTVGCRPAKTHRPERLGPYTDRTPA